MACCSIKNCNSPLMNCTNGNVCDKTCVETLKVFDAGIQQKNISATLTVDFGTETATSIISIGNSGGSVIENLVITPIPGSVNSRVTFTLSIPVTVVGNNAQGTVIYGTSTLSFEQDLVLRVPQEGVISPQIEATAIVNGLSNTVAAGNIVTTNACVTIITKVVAEVLLVIPSYGYLVLPNTQEYTQEACGSVFNTPVFPR